MADDSTEMRDSMAVDNNLDLKGFASKAVHSGTNHIGDAVNTPIFQSSTYKLTDERYAGWAAGAQHTLLYARISSVNSAAVAEKLAAMEGGEDAETFSSGMAAISTTLMSFLSAGDHIVASPDVYGGTYGLLTEEFPRFGIETTMADMRDPASYEAAIQPNTKILYIETLTNPVLKVCDIPAMVEIAKRHNLLCIIDNTFTSPWACQPLSMGVDLVIHSTTKYLGGHSDIIGGGVVGSKELIAEIFGRKAVFGGNPDPHTCYLLERGMRTLHVRMPVLCQNAAELARRLEAHPMIEKVNHPSLVSHEDYEVAQRVMPKGTGMIAFVVKGGDEAALKFMRGLKMIYEATSLGGVESLVECPFNSSHMMIPEDVRHAAGLTPGFVRISIGIEDVEDLWTDLERGFANL
ncbi:MAG: aminotransferase class I/II-fold pyridoxal phosphate-dependent enzyme [Euryarchaeota archaeon]|nr:aminotransferase class I/II-fold pyridoxal phosphate-dependent enzyme [Euryarchaeota archaeon]MBT5595374.1 aminotransferase class I/II-fold pyridoxal phosphate-dependent enzyme [Euryarchaeota archaeon]MBT5844080.1 aminotransferase class I/II-fold pyridoxal phosphate-dependent enzyme [Euryarchaeota archaeon]MBT6640811.1 aminotransferase class I/II-fold pyridoxal phosphate-dependent enzyme [Euryarchaeota archaeon]MBT6845497.1 aminotransferase class I/II-fold pyridoxal phosphate-dependent enzym